MFDAPRRGRRQHRQLGRAPR